MRKLLFLLIPVALACGEKGGPAPSPTPPPEPIETAVPVAPTPVPPEPCVQATFSTQWKGACQPSPTCKGPDARGFYNGTDCKQAGK
jgi:hypothetical protein